MRFPNFDITQGTPISMNESFNTRGIYLGNIKNFSIQLVFPAGTPVGTFSLQISNDPASPNQTGFFAVNDPVNWTNYLGSEQAISAAGDHTWNVGEAGYNFVRVVYTRTSGASSLTVANLTIKDAK